MTSEPLVEVLAAHRWAYVSFQQRVLLVCTCGDQLIPPTSSGVATLADYNTHLAEALAPLLAEVRAEALREAAEDMVWDFDGDVSRAAVRSWLSDLADREQVPGERREGGEG